MNVAVLASGTGTNLQALLDRVHEKDGISIVAVASDKPQAPALERARIAGVPTRAFPTEDFPDRVINVHPALLPAFPGLRPVEDALAYGVKVFGVTVHFVDSDVDSGPVILQRAVELPDAGDAASVLERLHPIEHELLPEAVRLIARGAVSFDSENPRRVVIAPGSLRRAAP